MCCKSANLDEIYFKIIKWVVKSLQRVKQIREGGQKCLIDLKYDQGKVSFIVSCNPTLI